MVLQRFHDGAATVRVGTGPDAEHLIPTDLEHAAAAEAERDAAQAELAALRAALDAED